MLFFCFCEKFLFRWQQLQSLLLQLRNPLLSSSFLDASHPVNYRACPLLPQLKVNSAIGQTDMPVCLLHPSASTFLHFWLLILPPFFLGTVSRAPQSPNHQYYSSLLTWNPIVLVVSLDLYVASFWVILFPCRLQARRWERLSWPPVSFALTRFHHCWKKGVSHTAWRRTSVRWPTRPSLAPYSGYPQTPPVAYMQRFQRRLCPPGKWYTLHWCQSQWPWLTTLRGRPRTEHSPAWGLCGRHRSSGNMQWRW